MFDKLGIAPQWEFRVPYERIDRPEYCKLIVRVLDWYCEKEKGKKWLVNLRPRAFLCKIFRL